MSAPAVSGGESKNVAFKDKEKPMAVRSSNIVAARGVYPHSKHGGSIC